MGRRRRASDCRWPPSQVDGHQADRNHSHAYRQRRLRDLRYAWVIRQLSDAGYRFMEYDEEAARLGTVCRGIELMDDLRLVMTRMVSSN
jgi:hypothetical protein